MNKEKNCKGKCPFCGSEDLEYGVLEIQDESLYYPFTCNNCDKEGEEWYDVEYSTTTYTKQPEKIKTNEAILVCPECQREIEVEFLNDIVECPNCKATVSKETAGKVL